MRPARRDYRSRGTAAIIAVAFHIAFLFLLIIPLRRVPVFESPALPPMQVRLIDQPRGQHPLFDRRAIVPRLSKPSVRLANSAPNVDITIPVDILPPPQPSQMRASLPAGTKDVAADGSPRGTTEGSGESAGPAIVHQVPPVYSVTSQRAHEQGTVTLRVFVDAHGVPSQVRLVQSSGFPRLDRSALEAVKRYRYAPPAHEAQSWATARVEFDLLRMPVATSVIQYDSLIAEQVAHAQRSRDGLEAKDRYWANDEVRRLADRLTGALARGGATSNPPHSHSSPTPLQMLAAQGNVKHMQFVGVAGPGFDCGSPTAAVDPKAVHCEVFEAQQDHGSSYWLALVDDDPLRLRNLLVTVGAQPLSAGSLAR
ncbi:MAG TPA: energy transducer TonB [Steroidobacteraceae bacterium]